MDLEMELNGTVSLDWKDTSWQANIVALWLCFGVLSLLTLLLSFASLLSSSPVHLGFLGCFEVDVQRHIETCRFASESPCGLVPPFRNPPA